MASDVQYEPLPKIEETKTKDETCASTTDLRRNRTTAYFAVIATVISSILLVTFLSMRVLRADKQRPCGSSPEEALSRGCHFDLMSFCWLPDLCYDPSLTDDFIKAGPWKWYSAPDGGDEIPEDIVRTGVYDNLFVSFDYHRNHCLHMWSKLHRAIIQGNPIDGYIGNYNHTLHCQEMLLDDDTPDDAIMTIIKTKYPSCGGLS